MSIWIDAQPMAVVTAAERGEKDFPDNDDQILSGHPKKYPAAKGGNIGRVWQRPRSLAALEIKEKAFFSTRSTALHQSAALTLRGGSA